MTEQTELQSRATILSSVVRRLCAHIGLPALILVAFALRLYRLGVPSLWYDETVSLFLARQDLAALTRHTAGDIHPPLYYYLLHFWGRLAGWSEFSAAFLSLFFGVLLVALVYRVARVWFDRRVALIAAGLVAISPYNLWYSQEVRMYTLGAVLGLASVYFLVRMLWQATANRRPPTVIRDFIAYVVISALGLYTLYYFAFLLVFENLVALVWLIRKSKIENRKTIWRLWIFSQLVSALLYGPWLAIAFRQATDPPVPPWRSFTPLPNVLLESFAALALGQSIDPIVASPMLVVIAFVIASAFGRDRALPTAHRPLITAHCLPFTVHHSPPTAALLFAYTLIPLLLIYALSLWKPLYHVRYVFIYSPAFYILLALGLCRIVDWKPPVVRRALLFAFNFSLLAFSAYSAYNFWFDPRYADDDLRGAVRYLAAHWRPGDAILVNAGYTYTAFVYYFDQPIAWRGRLTDYIPRDATAGAIVLQTGSIGGAPSLGWGDPASDFGATTADATRAALDRVFAAHPRLWQFRLYDTVVDPDGVIRDYLAQHGRIIDDAGFRGEAYARAQGYLTTRAPLDTLPATATRRDVLLGERIALVGFEPATASVRAGAPLDVTLYWQAREPTNLDLHLFVGLFARDGTLVASGDEIPLGNALGTARWSPGELLRAPARLNIPAHVAPGAYILRVAMYNPLTGEPLAASPGEWVAEGSQVILTQVRVE